MAPFQGHRLPKTRSASPHDSFLDGSSMRSETEAAAESAHDLMKIPPQQSHIAPSRISPGQFLRVSLIAICCLPTRTFAADRPTPTSTNAASLSERSTALPFDITGPDFDPLDCPSWAKERHPAWVLPFVGKNGLPAKWQPRGPLATSVKGL